MKDKAALIYELRVRTAALLSNLRRRSRFEQREVDIPILTDVVTQPATGLAVLAPGADVSAPPIAEDKIFSEAQVRMLMNDVLDSVLHGPGAHAAFALDDSLRLHLVQAAQDAFANAFFDLRQQMVDRVGEAMRAALEDRLQASSGRDNEHEHAALAPLAGGGNPRNPL
jgi:hypothetical protein